jgi:protein-disulfide isomerase
MIKHGGVTVLTAMLAATIQTTAIRAQSASPQPAPAQFPQDQQVLDELKKIRQLLQLIEQMIAQQNAPARAPGPTEDKTQLGSVTVTGTALGKSDAPLTMVEYTDLQCPFCRQFHVNVFDQIRKDYIDTGKLRYISRDYPLDMLHPLAQSAARAARCGANQGRFWEMRHGILVNNAHLTADTFTTLAQDLHLDVLAFTACLTDQTRFQTEIQKDVADGSAVGVTGTPSFVVGRSSAAGVTDGVRIVGAQPYGVFDTRFKELLGGR